MQLLNKELSLLSVRRAAAASSQTFLGLNCRKNATTKRSFSIIPLISSSSSTSQIQYHYNHHSTSHIYSRNGLQLKSTKGQYSSHYFQRRKFHSSLDLSKNPYFFYDRKFFFFSCYY